VTDQGGHFTPHKRLTKKHLHAESEISHLEALSSTATEMFLPDFCSGHRGWNLGAGTG
jgi:hypothetical protein